MGVIDVPDAEYICKKLGEWYDPPCSYGFGDLDDVAEFMSLDDDGEWCNAHCGTHDDGNYCDCWMRFFELLHQKEGVDG